MSSRKLPPGVYQLPSGSYRAVVSIHGEKHYATFATIAEAVAWREACLAAAKTGDALPDPVREAAKHKHRYAKYEDVAFEWLQHHARTRRQPLTPRTILLHEQALKNHILPPFGKKRLNEIRTDDAEAFRDRLVAQGIGIEWQKRLLWILRSSLEYACSRGWADSNPAAMVYAVLPTARRVTKKPVDYITPSQTLAMSRIVRTCYRLALWLQRLCGLRISEAFGLQIRDWDAELRVLHVQRQGGRRFSDWDKDGNAVWLSEVNRTKTPSGDRLIGVPELLAALIDDHIARHRSEAQPWDPLIVGPEGGRNSSAYGHALKKAASELGIVDDLGNPATTHDLRKSFAAHLDAVQARYRQMSYLLGHKGGAFDGAAAITHGIYNVRTPIIQEIVATADRLNQSLHEEGIHSLDVSDVDRPSGDWIELIEACSILDVCERTICDYAKAGKLSLTTIRVPGMKFTTTFVLRPDVDALIEQRANRVSVRDAAQQLGVDDGAVVRAARELGIGITHAVDGLDRAWFSTAGFAALATAFGLSSRFTAAHVPLSRAARELGVKSDTLRRLISRGMIEAAAAPVFIYGMGLRHAVWIARDRVAELAATKEQWLGARRPSTVNVPGMMSTTQAAAELQVSQHTVRKLYVQGVLAGQDEPTPGRRRIWIDPASLDAYRRQRTRQGSGPDGPAGGKARPEATPIRGANKILRWAS